MTLDGNAARLLIAVPLVGMSLNACGGGGEALDKAAKACGAALSAQAGRSVEALTKDRQEAADLAATAASKDKQWKDLATAVNDYAVTTEELADATKNVSSLTTFQLQSLGDRAAAAKRDITSACRSVKAAGGKFEGL